MTAEKRQPIACTLSGDALQDRCASIAALARDALHGNERNDLTLRLRFARGSLQRVWDMVRNEQACCSFLVFELDERPDEIEVTITAPEAARTMADSLFAQFTTLAGPRP